MPYKDKEKARASGRRSAAKNREKRKLYWQEYSSKEENKAKIKAYKNEYDSKPEMIEAKRRRSASSYRKNRDVILARQSARRDERNKLINSIATHYGCRNPNCLWAGELKTYQIDFHHLDPSTKYKEVAKMSTASLEKIVAELNKCVCLCRNCHSGVHKGDINVDESMMCRVNYDFTIMND